MSNTQPSLGRRVLPAIALTAAGVGMVQALDRPVPGPSTSGTLLPAQDSSAASIVTPSSVTPSSVVQGNVATSGGISPPQTSRPKPSQATPTQTAAPQVAEPQATVPVTAQAPSAASACGVMSGTGSETPITWNRQYGVVRVTVQFMGDGTLCKATAAYQTFDSRSERYESYAIPILNQQAMAAKSSNIQGISGATAVSEAYARSLQSAIDNKK